MALFLREVDQPFKTFTDAARFLRANPSYLGRNSWWLRRHHPVLFAEVAGPAAPPALRAPTFEHAVSARLSEPEPVRGPGSRKPRLLESRPRRTVARRLPSGAIRVRSGGLLGVQAEIPPDPPPTTARRSDSPLGRAVRDSLSKAGGFLARLVGEVPGAARVVYRGIKKMEEVQETIGRRTVQDIYDVIVGFGPGLVATARGLRSDPIGTLEEMGKGFVEPFRDPYQHPGLFVLNIAGLGGLGASGALRLRAGAGAAKLERERIAEMKEDGLPVPGKIATAGRVARAALVRKPEAGGSLLRRPSPGFLTGRAYGETISIPLSPNPLVRQFQRHYWNKAFRKVTRAPRDQAGSWLARVAMVPAVAKAVRPLTAEARLGRRMLRERAIDISTRLGYADYVMRLANGFVRKDAPFGSDEPVALMVPRNVALGLAMEWGNTAFSNPTLARSATAAYFQRVIESAGQKMDEIDKRLEATETLATLKGKERREFLRSLREQEIKTIKPEIADRLLDHYGRQVEHASATLANLEPAFRLIEEAAALRKSPTKPASKEAARFLELYSALSQLSMRTQAVKIGIGLDTSHAALRLVKPSLFYRIFHNHPELDPLDPEHLDLLNTKLDELLEKGELPLPKVGDTLVPPAGVAYLTRHSRYFPEVVFPTRASLREGPFGPDRPTREGFLPELTEEFSGAALAYGYAKFDVVGAVMSNHLTTVRFSHILDVWQKAAASGSKTRPLLPSGKPDPNYIAIRVRPRRETYMALQEMRLQLDSGPDSFGKVHRELWQRLKDEIFPDDVEAPGVVWADKRFIRDLIDPGSARPTGILKLFDLFNEAYRDIILYLSPRYALNIGGNALIGLIAQSPVFVSHAYRAMMLPRHLTEDLGHEKMRSILSSMDAAMGETRTRSFGAPYRISRNLQRAWNTLTDIWFRRATFLAEAARMGYRSSHDLERLFEIDPSTGQLSRFDDVRKIALRANRAAVDFDNALLTPLARNQLRRIFILYPWTRAATEWTLRQYMDRPTLQLASTILADQARRSEPVGLPRWARSAGMVLWPAGRDKFYSITVGSIHAPYTTAQVMDALDEARRVFIHGQPAQGDLARLLQAGLGLFLGPMFAGEQPTKPAGLVGIAQRLPQVAPFFGTPTYPEPSPLRLVGGPVVPRQTEVERLRRQHEQEMGPGVNEERRWVRFGQRLLQELDQLGIRLSQRDRYYVRLAFFLRSQAARIVATEGGKETPERKLQVINALLSEAQTDRLRPYVSYWTGRDPAEMAQLYRRVAGEHIAAHRLSFETEDKRERAMLTNLLQGWVDRIVGVMYGGNTVERVLSSLRRTYPQHASRFQILETD